MATTFSTYNKYIPLGGPSLDPHNLISPRHLSLPTEPTSSSYNDLTEFMKQSHDTLGLGDTGRMISSALSDGYLPNIGLDDTPKVTIVTFNYIYIYHYILYS